MIPVSPEATPTADVGETPQRQQDVGLADWATHRALEAPPFVKLGPIPCGRVEAVAAADHTGAVPDFDLEIKSPSQNPKIQGFSGATIKVDQGFVLASKVRH